MNQNPLYPFALMFLAGIFLVAAYFSPHEESMMDIFFLASGIVAGTISINTFRKRRTEKQLRAY